MSIKRMLVLIAHSSSLAAKKNGEPKAHAGSPICMTMPRSVMRAQLALQMALCKNECRLNHALAAARASSPTPAGACAPAHAAACAAPDRTCVTSAIAYHSR